MSKTLPLFIALCTATLTLSACDQLLGSKENTSTTQPATQQEQPTPPQSGEGLVRQSSEAAPAQVAITSIQSKPYADGQTVHLSKARVVGQILTIEFVFEPKRKPSGEYEYARSYDTEAANLAYIDDASAQKVGVLQDEAGKYMLSPQNSSGDKLRIEGRSFPETATLKFPAPPASTQSISIDLPGIGSFDGVPITR